tara:strand:+ start:183 stop:425 length:243 start_codon:yes stop_codon:yes gene_type:complete
LTPVVFCEINPIYDINQRKEYITMTDITKYKNVSLSHKTYDLIDKIRKVIQPDTILSRSQTISILVNEKARKLNGKVKKT